MSTTTLSPRRGPSLSDLVQLLQTAFPKTWENHLHNLGVFTKADLTSAELTRFTERVFWEVKQTGIKDPAAWLAFRACANHADGSRKKSVKVLGGSKEKSKTTSKPIIINGCLVSDGFLFQAPIYRGRYIGAETSKRPQWLKDNPGRWIRLQDFENALYLAASETDTGVDDSTDARTGAAPSTPDNSCCDERNDSTAAKDTNETASPLGEAVAGIDGNTAGTSANISCRDERNDSIAGKDTPKTAAAPLAGADAAEPSACDERKDGTNAVASATENPTKDPLHPHHPRTVKRSRRTRRRRKRKLPTEVSSQKCSPARLRLILDCLAETPVRISATKKADIHRNALRGWLKGSAEGHSIYRMWWHGRRAMFHKHFESAMEEGNDQLDEVAYRLAFGHYEQISIYRGRVVYKIDPTLRARGFRGPEAYLRDKNGNAIPEMVRKFDKKSLKRLLQRKFPDKYGKHPKSSRPPQSGGVLIVDMPKPKKESRG